ncbi:MAG: hypothetical protein O3A92_03265 [Verrucomicrobia bacterium]|jgi:hypothetical protein|nr:hypothetical protein [Verrucomicrobiota bacterium]
MSDGEHQKLQREAAEVTLKMRRDFYDTLGTEDPDQACCKEGGTRGSLKLSSLLKKTGMKNCESFWDLARREEGVGRDQRPTKNAARFQKGRSPQGFLLGTSGEAAL